jgi:hypothetical protein
MKPRPTTAQWLGLAFGAALLAAVLAVRQRGDLLRFAEDEELVRLRAEHQRLSTYEPAAVHALQVAADALNGRRAAQQHWPEGWSTHALSAPNGSSEVSWRITAKGTPTWTGLVNAVAALVSVPGNRIVSVEIRSRGTLSEREIASVDIVLVQPTPTPSRRNPSGGTGWPGPEVPATPPAVGAGPSLRRPAASAEPPAADQAYAPVRPDPRGPRAGSFSTHKPQPKQP